MLFGLEGNTPEYTSPEVKTIHVDKETKQQAEVTTQGPPAIENKEYKQAPVHFTQKMASFIEGIVKGFYEIIVQMLYQVVQLFY